jgi:tetratricopeptide (TPR) repeat protein
MAFPEKIETIEPLTYDAISLFLQSAGKVRPGFDPSPEELGQIASICQIVGGMPLAIELAAAWLHVINVGDIAGELEKDYDILATEVRDAPKRHRSIRTVFDQSWSLLDSTEQEIFMLLSVFRGGFTREAAHQVAGAWLPVLAGFVNKSFLSHDPDSGRFEIHELLRQYSKERLEAETSARISSQEAHAAYFADFMQEKREQLKGPRQLLALSEIEVDIENVRAAWRYYLSQRNTAQIWKFIYGIWHLYWIRWWNHAGMELFAEAEKAFQGEEGEDCAAVRALAMAFQAYFMAWLGLSEQGIEIAEESVSILEQLNYPEALAFAYDCFGVNAYFLNRYTEEIEAIDKMVELTSGLDDKWLMAFTLFGQGMAALVQEDFAKARELAEWNLRLYEELGDVIDSSTPLIVLGHASLAVGELEEAREYYQRCLKISQETGFYYAMQTATKYLGKVTLALGQIAEAEKHLLQSLKITEEIGFVRDIVNLLYEYARLQVAEENIEGAVELLALVIQHPASNLYRMLEGRIRDSARNLLEKLEPELPQDIFDAAMKRGQELELDVVVARIAGSKFSK